MLLSEMIVIIPLLAFQIRSAFSEAKKLLQWIIEHISHVSYLSKACVLTVNFSVFCISEESLVVITFEKKVADWSAGWATKSVILGSGPTHSLLTAEIATSKSVPGDTGKLIGHCIANSTNQN